MNYKSNEINKSLRFSFLDGVFASAMAGFIQDYLTPFLLLLGATARHIGMLNAFPNFCASLMQLRSADLVDKLKSRKKIINIFVFLQALMLIPMAVAAMRGVIKPPAFIMLVVLFTCFGAIATPAWASWMSDLVEKDRRGEYFGWRNRVLGFIMVGASFTAGFILHFSKRFNIFYGFVIIFGVAGIFRLISWYFLNRMHEPFLENGGESHFTFFDFLSRARESNFTKFVLFVSIMHFCVNLVSPFFAVLMLKELKFSYLVYTVVTVAATLSIYSTMGRWGRHADKVGNLKIIKLTASLIGVIPLLWIINRHPIYLFFVQVFAGFLWAGFNLCIINFIYDAVKPEKRTRCIAYFNVLNGTALCFGALLGGFLLQKLPIFFGYKILTLCFISAILRLSVGLIMPSNLKEVRPVREISNTQLLFSVIGIKPLI